MGTRRSLWIESLFAILSLPILAATGIEAGTIETVVGSNNIAIDRINIQQAIDRAGEGGRVLLDGEFQLDGEALSISKRLTLEGVVVDNDGDGADNEDWIDGIDNDGDGLTDEDDWEARLIGLTDASGAPIPETDRTVVFNRAIFIRGLDGEVNGLRIRDLRFSGHFRAITLEPDTGSFGGTVCENLFSTTGILANLAIESNRFDNNGRAIELEGHTKRARIARNVVADASNISMIVEGVEMGCPLMAGGFDTFPIGTPEQTMVVDNIVSNSALYAIFNFNALETRILGNRILDGDFAILSQGESRVWISDNDLLDVGFIGMELAGAVETGTVTDNRISGGFFGVLVDPGGSGYQIKDNEFSQVLFADVLLDFGSFGNTVIVEQGDVVIDDGEDNVVKFE